LPAKYVIGIDLGTTNSTLSYAEIRADADPFAPANVELMPIQQAYHFCIHNALRKIADPAAIPLLQQLSVKTRNRDRREQIQKVINDLEKASPPQ